VDGDGHEVKADALQRAWRTFRHILLRATAARGKRRWRVLLVAILAITTWQYGFTAHDAKIDTKYANLASSGVHNDQFFVYFFWYTGLFPVESTLQHDPCVFRCAAKTESWAPAVGGLSHEAAEKFLKTQGNTLVMDSSWTWYAGDRGKIFLFMLDTWLKGDPWRPSMKPMHRLVFIIALSSLFFSFWRLRRPLLGGLAVVFLGSNPFQIFEVNSNDNVFSWVITTAILMLAIHLPMLVGKRMHPRWVFLWPIAAGLMMATIRTVRSEPMPLVASALFAYLVVRFRGKLTSRQTWMRRGALVLTFMAFVFVGHQIWARYFLFKHEEAVATLVKVGGHPYPGNVRLYHHFWHPVWCGLGDFDTTKGYAWDDTKALDYAKPILEKKFHQYVPSPWLVGSPKNLDEYWDAEGLYKKLPYDIPNYNEIIRDKVLSDIESDPLWYAAILAKRFNRIVNYATPVRLSTRLGWVDLPFLNSRLLFLPFLLLCFAARARFAWRLMVVTLPSVSTPLIVFCDKGLHYYGVFHLFTAAVVVAAAVELARRLVKRVKRAREARAHAA
jgi:hypothetical protein